MKFKKLMLLGTIAIAMISAGCNSNDSKQEQENVLVENEDSSTDEKSLANEESPMTEEATTKEDMENKSIMDENLLSQIPDTIEPVLAEMKEHTALNDFIAKTFDIPKEDRSKTKYYYNYVDFNGDGNNEIFALVMGPYTSGSGGSTAIIAFETKDGIMPVTTMSVINTPIIISENSTKGMNDIIVKRSGGGSTPAFVKLTSTGEGNYTTVADGEVLESLDGIKGKMIISNDIMNDMEKDLVLKLK
ncbi:MAG: hypothetical protein N4A54_00305 [Peptostreptococcaceae bacterium]|jgi:hypothetical protein|nr:hypothetical protein [Peptostreptococcaceae bacterium]